MSRVIKLFVRCFLLGAILGVLNGCGKSTIDILEEIDCEDIKFYFKCKK